MCTVCRGVARKKSRCRHLRFRGACPLGNIFLYRRSCILSHFKAYFEGNNFIFCRVCRAEKIHSFLYAHVKKRDFLWENVRRAHGRCPEHFLLNNFNSFHCIIIKLYENVCWQNISAKFDNQPDPIKHFGVMAIELSKIAKINRVRSVT